MKISSSARHLYPVVSRQFRGVDHLASLSKYCPGSGATEAGCWRNVMMMVMGLYVIRIIPTHPCSIPHQSSGFLGTSDFYRGQDKYPSWVLQLSYNASNNIFSTLVAMLLTASSTTLSRAFTFHDRPITPSIMPMIPPPDIKGYPSKETNILES
jgi:hypothetical protein